MSTISPMRVLVVDDNDDAAITMAFLLKRYGHEAIVARSGEAALQQAPVFHPDVMFIDLAMPGIDGLDVARRLRETAEFSETPLVAVSGFVDAEHRTQATAAGFSEFLAKPYPLAMLEAVMERVAVRISAGRTMAATARKIAEQSRQRNEQSRQELDHYWRTRRVGAVIPISVAKSGFSSLVTLPVRSAADELRGWLKEQRCRVGPIFETDGQFSFFVYSKRHCLRELIGKNGGFSVS